MSATQLQSQTQWQSLFVQLIGSLQQDLSVQSSNLHADAGSKEVVIELCLNGFLYVLTRCPSASAGERIVLSQREKEIIRLVCGGMPNKAISDVLEISPWTVATYLKRIFAKLAVSSRAEMVARVLQEGLLDQANERHR